MNLIRQYKILDKSKFPLIIMQLIKIIIIIITTILLKGKNLIIWYRKLAINFIKKL
jgi:hypothetical protein